MRRRTRWYLALALAGLGCGGATTADEAVELDDEASEIEVPAGGKLDRARGVPIGTFRAAPGRAGQLTLLVLRSDRTFHREVLVTCVRAPCPPVAQHGTYRLTRGVGTRYLRFYDEGGRLLDRRAYLLLGEHLWLRRAGTWSWERLEASQPAWCAAPEDCGLQDLVHVACAGAWRCEDGACAYRCDVPGSRCEDHGGRCVAVYPGTCDETDHVIASGEGYTCGAPGTVGTWCCMPRAGCAPVCAGEGTAEEGWRNPCTGETLCAASCAGATATCGAIGSRSEGWYAAGHGCEGRDLIAWDNCDPR